MAIFNESYINEFFGFGKKKKQRKEYHHLNKNEISKCISIAKGCIKDFPKLKKSCSFINPYDEYEDYYESSGNAEFPIIDGDAWKGYPNVRQDASEFWDDCSKFMDALKEKAVSENIQDIVDFNYFGDWDDVRFTIISKKEK